MIVRPSNKKVEERTNKYFAKLTLWVSMAHFVAEKLKIRPNEVLDNWGCAELLVAYGNFANEIAERNVMEWKALPRESQVKNPKPDTYFVEFIDG